MTRSPRTVNLKPNRARAEAIVTDLLSVPGKSCEEAAIMEAIKAHLRKAGLDDRVMRHDTAHRRSDSGGQIGNLIVKLPGVGSLARAPRRMLMAHVDTVPICVGARPIKRGGRIVAADPDTGLGGDDRAGAAAVLIAALELLERNIDHPPLTFLWTVQEEIGLKGARWASLNMLGNPAMAFNFDGGDPARLVIGATGAYRMTITLEGLATHAGNHPEKGVSALAAAALAIADLQEHGWHGLVMKGGKRGTSNVGVFEAGPATNVVNARAVLRAEARAHDPKLRRRIVVEYRKAFERAARKVRNDEGRAAKVAFDIRHDYEAFALKKTDPVVRIAAEVLAAAGQTVRYDIATGGLDANWMTAHGVPTVTMGVGQQNIHTVSETLDLKMFHAGCEIALRLAAG